MKKTCIRSFALLLLFTIPGYSGTARAQDIQAVPISPGILSPAMEQGAREAAASPLSEGMQQETGDAAPSDQALPEGESLPQTPAEAGESASEFEQFISGKDKRGISTDIQQFGYDLFRRPPSTFAPATHVPVGPDYVIGPGDGIGITVWGKVEGRWSVGVDRDGNITLPKVGVLGVTGLTFSELKALLHKEFSKYYTGFEMNVSMGSLKSMRVYIVGNVKRPGAYTVSSLSTLLNAFMAAGGPSKTGTMRNVELKRQGETIEYFDMYDFLLRGDKTQDVRLMPEDVIFVPTVGPLAGIAGNVKSPAIYELKGETRLLDLINMAGGLTSVAFTGRVQVQRTEDHTFRTIFEGDLIGIDRDEQKNFVLTDGDLVKVFAILQTKNTAVLSGAVANPGNYGVLPGETTVKDVLSLAGGVLYYASSNAELTRVTVTPSGPSTEQIYFDVFKALEGDPEHNLPLQINDYIMVRSVPEWKLYRTASITGEVKYPGTYTIQTGERLSSLIERAGGYTERAYLRGAVFTRNSVRAVQQKALGEMITRLQRELLAEGSVEASTALSGQEIAAKKVELEQKRQFVESLKRVSATGRLSIRLSHLRLLKHSEYDIELEEGDSLAIPMKNSMVNVIGAVMSTGSFVFSDTIEYDNYIEMAGGYSSFADKDKVYVLKVDGTARKLGRGFMNWNIARDRWELMAFGEDIREIEPGDTIVVPEKLERIAWMREIKDITQILYQIATTAGVLIVAF